MVMPNARTACEQSSAALKLANRQSRRVLVVLNSAGKTQKKPLGSAKLSGREGTYLVPTTGT